MSGLINKSLFVKNLSIRMKTDEKKAGEWLDGILFRFKLILNSIFCLFNNLYIYF